MQSPNSAMLGLNISLILYSCMIFTKTVNVSSSGIYNIKSYTSHKYHIQILINFFNIRLSYTDSVRAIVPLQVLFIFRIV